MLKVQNLTISFKSQDAYTTVVNDCSFTIHPNEIVGIVGESGRWKISYVISAHGLLPLDKASISGSIMMGKPHFTPYLKSSGNNGGVTESA